MNDHLTKQETIPEMHVALTAESKSLRGGSPAQILDDHAIVDLFWARSEQAIDAVSKKYVRYCTAIAFQILRNAEDADESVNDTWLAAWEAMPPHRPEKLSSFLRKITRRIAIDRLRKRTAKKRDHNLEVIFDELEPTLASVGGPSDELLQELERQELAASLNRFLATLAKADRQVFVCRYWYMLSVSEISERFALSESNVKSKLHRTRAKLRKYLEKEGMFNETCDFS